MLSRVATIVACTEKVPLPTAFERYAQIDQAAYDFAPIDPPAALVALAASKTERPLQPVWAKIIRMHPGDYLLAHHDHEHDDHRVELILDLSPAVVPDAEVRYRRGGNVFFRFPSQPGHASIVERARDAQAYHTYISKLHTGALVQRLVLLLAEA